MATGVDDFAARLRVECSETESIVAEHLRDFDGEVLLHLLIADIRRCTISAFDAGDADVVQRCLSVVADGLRDGDDHVENAVAVSFVEDTEVVESRHVRLHRVVARATPRRGGAPAQVEAGRRLTPHRRHARGSDPAFGATWWATSGRAFWGTRLIEFLTRVVDYHAAGRA